MKRDTGIRTVVGGVVIACALVLAGCPQSKPAQTPPRDSAPSRPADIEHRVSYSGETLALIAAWYTGRSSNWTIIREANPGLRPERINLGQTVIVPGGIVVERRPLPKKFVQDSLAKFRPTISTPSTPPPVADPLEPVFEESITPPPSEVKVEPTNTAPTPDEVNLEAILKEQIEAQKKAGEAAVVPPPVQEPPVAPPVVDNTPPKEEKAPAAPGDSEREQLLDELLTQ